MTNGPILGAMRERAHEALMTRRPRILVLERCEWRFGAQAYADLVAELRRDHAMPGKGKQLTLSVDGIRVREDEQLAADVFYLKEA